MDLAVANYSMSNLKQYKKTKNYEKIMNYKCINCDSSIKCRSQNNMWGVICISGHTCSKDVYKTSRIIIENHVKLNGPKDSNLKMYFKEIQKKFKGTNIKKISRIYNRVFNRNKLGWISSFNRALNICKEIGLGGGITKIIENDQKTTNIVIMPKISLDFLKSEAFFGTIICGSTFSTSFLNGLLLILGVKLPNKSFFPAIFGWSNSEKSEDWEYMLNILKENKIFIKALVSDRGSAILSAFKTIFPNGKINFCY